MNSENSWKIQAICITIAGLLAHGLLLLTDYQVWDSFILGFFAQDSQNWKHLEHWCRDYGRPFDILFYLPYYGNEHLVFWSKAFGLSLWVGTFLLINSTLSPLLCIPRLHAFLIALVGVTLPFYEYVGEFVFNIYTIPYFLFWVGVYFYLRTNTARFPYFLIFRIGALAFFWFSFAFNALILFYLSIILVQLFLKSKVDGKFFLKSLGRKLLRNLDFLLIPFVFWMHKSIFCPLQGYPAQTGYNTIQKNISIYLTGTFASMEGISQRLLSIFDSFDVFFYLATITLFFSIIAISFRLTPNSPPANRKMIFQNILLGIFLLGAILFPYIAVGKPYGAFGYESRIGIGMNMPIAMILVMFGFFLQSVFEKWNRVRLVFIAACCGFGILESNRNYLRLSGYYAKQQSIVAKIQDAVESAPGTSVVHMREYFQMPKTTQWVPAVAWTYMATDADSLPNFLVVDTRNFIHDRQPATGTLSLISSYPQLEFKPEDIEHFCWLSSIPYTLENIARQGKTLNLAALEGSWGGDAEEIGKEYLMNRFFSFEKMPQFMQQITMVVSLENDNLNEIITR